LRVGIRMLWKSRGLTLVGGFAMAAAVTVGAAAFEILGQLLTPTLPFDPDGRIVAVQLRTGDSRTGPLALLTGEVAVESFDAVGAYRTVHLNVASEAGPAETIALAEMTTSGFTLAQVPPALGRHLQPHDASPAAPPVVVVGHRAWQTRFDPIRDSVGRVLVLSGVSHEVVCVRPESFGFPLDHQFWLPFRPSSVVAAGADGPEVHLFARLAPQATPERAAGELKTLVAGSREPGAPEGPTPTVSPYTLDHVDLSSPGVSGLLRGVQISTSLLVFVVAINLAIVLYARTVRRVGEIAVRMALGASRRRILVQLFVEALALTSGGAAVGLAVAALSLSSTAGVRPLAHRGAVLDPVRPVDDDSGRSRAAGRAFGADHGRVAGTEGNRAQRAQAPPRSPRRSGTASGPDLVHARGRADRGGGRHSPGGGVRGAGGDSDAGRRPRLSERAVQRRTHASAKRQRAGRDRSRPRALSARNGEARRRARRRGDHVLLLGPRAWPWRRYRVRQGRPRHAGCGSRREPVPDRDRPARGVWRELLAGRGFQPADAGTDAVVVNETFVAWLSDRATVLGARFRYTSWAGEPVVNGRWHQIVGVVRDFPNVPSRLAFDTPAAVYHPATLSAVNPIVISLRFVGEAPRDLAGRARQTAAEVDPTLQVARVLPLKDFYWRFLRLWMYVSWAINLVTASALVLSAAGLYAMMAFIVAQRQREIGLRTALGATPRRLLLSIFTRAARQLAIGIALGSLLSWMVLKAAGFDTRWAVGLVLAVAAITATAGVLAAVGPARRSLRIPVAEVLKAE
jgi:hypothetical protein